MRCLFLDNHVCVVEKPAGISTQPEFMQRVSLWLKARFQRPGNVFCEPAHRLDKVTTGVLLCARTSKSLSRLQRQFREGKIRKKYWACVEGVVPLGSVELSHYLVKRDHKAYVVSSEGQQALMQYKVLSHQRGKTFLEIQLFTGRYHQIRAQLAHVGYPILGDSKYGGVCSWRRGAIALRAIGITFQHPTKLGEVVIRCE